MRSRLTGAGGALFTLLAAATLTAAAPASVDRAGGHRAPEAPVVVEPTALGTGSAVEALPALGLTRMDSLALRRQVAEVIALEGWNPAPWRDSLPRGRARTPAATARRTPLNALDSMWRSATSPSADSCTSERAQPPSSTPRFRRFEQLRT